jgi:mannose-1-phosphate guanylyltransferase
MKAFLLAAGHGTRLRPFTESVPKCLLPVRGMPILEIWLGLCRQCGISEVLVNTHAHAPAVVEFVRKWKNGVRVSVVEERELFGSAGTLRANRSWVDGEETFWIFYADVLTNARLALMLEFHRPKTAATLGIYTVPDPERCGIVSLDDASTVMEFVEKPAAPKSNLAFAGILIGTPELLDAVPDTPGADIAADVLPRLTGRMRAYRIPEFVLDIGTPENYELAQKSWPGLEHPNPQPAVWT